MQWCHSAQLPRTLENNTKPPATPPPPPPHLPSIWALVEYGSVVAILPSSVFFPIGLDKVGRLRLLFQFILSIYLCVFSLCLSPSLFWRVAMSRLPLSLFFFFKYFLSRLMPVCCCLLVSYLPASSVIRRLWVEFVGIFSPDSAGGGFYSVHHRKRVSRWHNVISTPPPPSFLLSSSSSFSCQLRSSFFLSL